MVNEVMCLSYKERAGDYFPPRCVLTRGHEGKHKSVATHWVTGTGTQICEEWDDLTQ